jgi:hypothetical protein
MQDVLLSTVDRALTERGEDPELITPLDKMAIAAQYVQLYQLHEDMVQKACKELTDLLGISRPLPLMDLVRILKQVALTNQQGVQ